MHAILAILRIATPLSAVNCRALQGMLQLSPHSALTFLWDFVRMPKYSAINAETAHSLNEFTPGVTIL